MHLNKLQTAALNEVLYGDAQIVVLTGEGGTGKSTTTAEIIKAWNGSIAITATTNRAKEVLSAMSGHPARTVQSQMGYTMVSQGYAQYLAKVNEAECADLVIVEEISMLPRAVYHTLLEHLTEGRIKKLLMLGDPIQLPSIGPGVKIESIVGVHIELTEQMRQDASNAPLASYMAALRAAIESGNQIDLTPSEDLTAVRFIVDHKEFCKLYKSTIGVKKVIAYTNAVVDKYNQYIHDGDAIFNPGDQVLIDKPFQGASNGDTVMILEVAETDDYFKLKCVNGLGHSGFILHWKTRTAFEAKLTEYQEAEDIAMYCSLRDTSMRLKHQYACTVHKSQGSSYNTVFIDGWDIWQAHNKVATQYSAPPISYDLMLRLMYVAISRMRSQCYVYIGQTRKYEYLS